MMTEVPKSQLPKDPEYWEALTQRILQDASGPLAAHATSCDVWYDLLARRSASLVAASAAAMLLLWLALPAPESSVAFGWIERSVAPDEIAGTLLGGPVPPSVDALIVQFPPAPDEGGRH